MSKNGEDNDIAADLYQQDETVEDNVVKAAAERFMGDAAFLRAGCRHILSAEGKIPAERAGENMGDAIKDQTAGERDKDQGCE